MLLAALLAISTHSSLDRINGMLKARDYAGLENLLLPLPKGSRDPFAVIAAGGAYAVGRFGWNATELPAVGSGPGFVVIGTALTSEDIGELVFEKVGEKLKFVPEADSLGVSVVRHSFVLRFHPEKKGAVLDDRIALHATNEARTFLFRMSPQYKVSGIVDEGGNRVEFTESQGVVLARRPPSPDFVYKIHYSATVDLPQFAGSISDKEATLTNDYWYPMIARNPAPYDIEIHAPLGWTPVGQGEKLSQTDTQTETVAKFRMDLPVTYYSVSAAPYKTFSQVIGGRRISVWSLRMSQDAMEQQTELYAPILKFYEQFAPFPFTGYGAVDSAVYGGGALEAYSFATYGGGLPDEDAHEPSHTWWGGILDNTYLHSFWNESFAVYSDGLYHRNVPIGSVKDRRPAFVRDGAGSSDYDKVAILDGGVDAGSVSGSLGYGKGSQVLQMLEQLVGTDKMIRIMHDWIADHKKGTAAEWPEFVRTAEKDLPELKLESFFADWLARPGYARLTADVKYDGNATVIDLNWKGPRFRMPLLVLCRLASGDESYALFDTRDGDRLKIPGPKPAVVSIDPFRQALRDTGSDETPVQLSRVNTSKRLVDPAHSDWNGAAGGDAAPPQAPSDLSDTLIVGSPETLPWMKPLCDKAGFQVSGDHLTYKSTTIDLNHGCAAAVVDLGEGKFCKIQLGKTRHRPDFGRARTAVTDDLGRFLHGQTEPKTTGKLTYRL